MRVFFCLILILCFGIFLDPVYSFQFQTINVEEKIPADTKTRLFRKSLRFLDYSSNRQFDKAAELFSSGFPKEALTKSLSQTWSFILQVDGKYLEVEGIAASRWEFGYHIHAKVRFEKGSRGLGLRFTKDLAIDEFALPKLDEIPELTILKAPYIRQELFETRNISLGNAKYPIQGKLHLPIAVKDPPVVLFSHDFGPQDEDHRIGVNSFFKDLSQGLASNGIASIVFPKRSLMHKPEKNHRLSPTWEVLQDLYSALYRIRTIPQVQSSKVYFLGNGFGAYFAPYLATQDLFDGYILINPSFRSPLTILFEIKEFYESRDPSNYMKLQNLADKIELFEQGKLDGEETLFDYPAQYFYSLQRLDPTKLKVPKDSQFLTLFAQKDFVNNPADEPLVKQVLFKADLQSHSFPKLNRILHVGNRYEPEMDFHTPGVVSAKVIQIIRDWVVEKTYKPNQDT